MTAIRDGEQVESGAAVEDTRGIALRVGAMFDGIAGRYDLMNRLMSAGQDGRWRQIAVKTLRPLPPGPLLDLGAGTGDLALELRRRLWRRAVVGADLSAGMMQVGRAKMAARDETRVEFVQGNALRLPFEDSAFAGAATAFTLRNVPDLPGALAELRRVLKPRGRLAILEITRPKGGPLAALFSVYFHQVVPRAGAVIAGNKGAYSYLPASVDRFVTGEELRAALVEVGFEDVQMRRFWPGAVTLHSALKPG